MNIINICGLKCSFYFAVCVSVNSDDERCKGCRVADKSSVLFELRENVAVVLSMVLLHIHCNYNKCLLL